MRLPFKAAAAFLASPKGRETIRRARERYDTPENRERAVKLAKDVRARLEERKGRSAPKPRSGPSADRPGLP
jgi:hypothetical protein